MCFRRKRHDQFEEVIIKLIQRMRLVRWRVLDRVQSRMAAYKRVRLAFVNTGGCDEHIFWQHGPRDRFGHRRANGIHAAQKQNRAWHWFVSPAESLLLHRSAPPMQNANEREQPAGGIKIDVYLTCKPFL